MTKNKSKIESTAIAILEHEFANYKKLLFNAQKSDKNISWDGNISLYSNENVDCKDHFKGEVPIQIKGTQVIKTEDLKQNKESFPVDIKDIENYYKQKGVLFLYVKFIDNSHYKVYHAVLHKFELSQILEEIKSNGNKKKKNIKLTYLDLKNQNEIYQLLSHFIFDERYAINANTNKISSWRNSFNNENYKIILPINTNFTKKEILQYNENHDQYIYLEDKITGIKIPIDKGKIKKIIQTPPNSAVYIKGKKYFESSDIITTNKSTILNFGKFFKIEKDIDDDNIKINFKLENAHLSEYIKSLEFSIDFFKHKEITVNNISFPFNPIEVDINQYINELNKLKKLKKVLHELNIYEDIEISNLTKEDLETIYFLTEFVYSKKIFYAPDNRKFKEVDTYKLKNLNIKLCCLNSKFKNKDCIELMNFYNKNIRIETVNQQILNHFFVLTSEDLINDSNVNIQNIKESIEEDNDFDRVIEEYNNLLINILSAYDKTQNEDFYHLADFLSKKIFEKEPTNNIFYINKLQIKKRKNALTDEEIEKLFKLKMNLLKENDILNKMILICINILLESFKEAKQLIKTLPQKEIEIFNKFPINNLIK